MFYRFYKYYRYINATISKFGSTVPEQKRLQRKDYRIKLKKDQANRRKSKCIIKHNNLKAQDHTKTTFVFYL